MTNSCPTLRVELRLMLLALAIDSGSTPYLSAILPRISPSCTTCMTTPAVLLSVHSPDGTLQFWVFKGIEKMKRAIPDLLAKVPKFNPGRHKPYYFELNGIEQIFYTGLQLSHDPGVSVVAIGAFLIVAGFLVTFFSSHKRFWVRVDEGEGKTRIMVSARSNRDPVGLKRETEYLLRHIAAIRG